MSRHSLASVACAATENNLRFEGIRLFFVGFIGSCGEFCFRVLMTSISCHCCSPQRLCVRNSQSLNLNQLWCAWFCYVLWV